MNQNQLVIHTTQEIMGRTAVFVGTRVPFETLFVTSKPSGPYLSSWRTSRRSPGAGCSGPWSKPRRLFSPVRVLFDVRLRHCSRAVPQTALNARTGSDEIGEPL
jgi:hypothetical protein